MNQKKKQPMVRAKSAKATLAKKIKPDDESRVTLKVPEAARIAGCGERSIRDGIADGRIPHLKWGRNIVIPRSAFLRFIDSAGGSI